MQIRMLNWMDRQAVKLRKSRMKVDIIIIKCKPRGATYKTGGGIEDRLKFQDIKEERPV